MVRINVLHILRFPRFPFPLFLSQRLLLLLFRICSPYSWTNFLSSFIKRAIHPILLLRYVFDAKRSNFLFFKWNFNGIKINHLLQNLVPSLFLKQQSTAALSSSSSWQFYRQHLILFNEKYIRPKSLNVSPRWCIHKRRWCIIELIYKLHWELLQIHCNFED